jgi:putative two-component system response regulator
MPTILSCASPREIVYSHHERWDGTGYPQGLRGEEIPLAARLMALADVYDALISKRVYKAAFAARDGGGDHRHGRGAHFDPQLVDCFLVCADTFNEIAARHRDAEAADEAADPSTLWSPGGGDGERRNARSTC